MQHILVVDDDPTSTMLLRHLLESEGYGVTTAESALQALDYLDQSDYDLVLLDIMMPEMTGLDLCRHIRTTSYVPILFLTTLSDAADKVRGLSIGGDDYLTKPFDPDEVIARIEALLRRTGGRAQSDLQLRQAGLTLDVTEHTVTLQSTGKLVPLTPTETRLLHTLMRNAGRGITRDELVLKVGGSDYGHSSNQLDVYIARLRTKLDEDRRDAKLIQTVRGVGYRFGPAKEPAAASQAETTIQSPS